ncbi:hypothetical protein BT69DRAFT_1329682 [Atractiella rhizophila]|nr:hypothetical protein BT69DRAFT_1329682 [Atractiella rhizophila]
MPHKMPILNGGIPTSTDIAPTIIFLIIHIVLFFLTLRNLVLLAPRRALYVAHRPLGFYLGRFPFLALRIVQAAGIGRNNKSINIMQEIEVSIGHFPFIYTVVDLLPILVGRLHGKRYTRLAKLVVFGLSNLLLGATATGILEGTWWQSARNGSFSKQDLVILLRQITNILPFVVCCILVDALLRVIRERQHYFRTGKKMGWIWWPLNVSRGTDFGKISSDSLWFAACILVPEFVTTLYKVIIADFHLVPTPQDPASYPLPVQLFSATPRSNGLFYTLQLLMDCCALVPYAIFDVRKIYGLEGRWGWKVGKPETAAEQQETEGTRVEERDGNELDTLRPRPT